MVDRAIRQGDDGMVTAELAVGLPAFMLVVVSCMACVAAVLAQLRCTDGAAVGARMAARGESRGAIESVLAADLPASATWSLTSDTPDVTLTVNDAVTLPLIGWQIPWHLAAAVTEPAETQPAEPGPAEPTPIKTRS